MGLPLAGRPSTTIGPGARRPQRHADRARWPVNHGWLAAALVASVATAALGDAVVSAAELDPVALLWNAPVGCSTAEAVHEQVESSLGGASKNLAPVAAVVDVAAGSPGRWRAKLTLHARGKHAERQFEAESCDGLSAAAALIIALAAEDAAEAPAEVAGEQRPGPRPDVHALTIASSVRPPGWNLSGRVAQVGLSLDSGTMPRGSEPGLEASLGGVWSSELWRLRLLGRLSYFLPQDTFAPAGYESLGRYWLAALAGRGCATAALFRFELGPCLGAEVVAMHGSSIGGGVASSTQYWLAPVGGAVAAFAIAPQIVVFAQGEVAVPGTRRTFMGDSNAGFFNPVYTVPSFAIRGAAGFELRFF